MAATGPEDGAGVGPDGTAGCPPDQQASGTTGSRTDGQQSLVFSQSCLLHADQTRTSGWIHLQSSGPTMHLCGRAGEAPYSFRSPESVEMDEIMAAMVLTSLSCSPVVQSPPQTDPGPGLSLTPLSCSPVVQSPPQTDPGPGLSLTPLSCSPVVQSPPQTDPGPGLSLTPLSCSPVVQSPPQTDPGPGLSLTPLSCSPVVQSPPQTDPGPGLSLTPLSCSPVVQSPPQTDPGPDMECGGGELSDSGSSGYWSWDHGNVSPAPSPSVTEMDSSPDEGLHMELEQGEELSAKKPKSSFRGVYRCLWPSCGKVLTSSVGIKRHIRVLHLGSGSDQTQREEDFYYTRMSCDPVEPGSGPAPPPQQAPGPAPSPHLGWASCSSPPGSELQIPPAHRPRSNSSSGPGPGRPSPLSQSAPSSFWQIHSEHLYQACSPVQVSVAPRSPGSPGWTPPTPGSGPSNPPTVKPRCRSVSVGEQWLQQNRLQTMSASPSRNHCSFRKGRGEAKKCRKVYGVERKDQWCTACRWKKACQRFPD